MPAVANALAIKADTNLFMIDFSSRNDRGGSTHQLGLYLAKFIGLSYAMTTYTIHAAKTHLSRLIEEACTGEDIVIARGKQPLVRLVPLVQPPRSRVFGAMRGRATVTDAFFEPLPLEELDAWGQ